MPRRFFVSPGALHDGSVLITGPDVSHIRRVLRFRPGDKIEVADGSHVYLAELTSVGKELVIGRVVEERPGGDGESRVVLFQGLSKGAKMDEVIRGACEAGADEIVPVITERSVPEVDVVKGEKRAERWRRVAAEASKQARRSHLVGVSVPISFEDALEHMAVLDTVIVFWEGEEEALVSDVLQKTSETGGPPIGVVVGPEGGLTLQEVERLRLIGGKTVTLGRSILRTETAGIVAVAIVEYEMMRVKRRRS